jgi:hypothetical protein
MRTLTEEMGAPLTHKNLKNSRKVLFCSLYLLKYWK